MSIFFSERPVAPALQSLFQSGRIIYGNFRRSKTRKWNSSRLKFVSIRPGHKELKMNPALFGRRAEFFKRI